MKLKRVNGLIWIIAAFMLLFMGCQTSQVTMSQVTKQTADNLKIIETNVEPEENSPPLNSVQKLENEEPQVILTSPQNGSMEIPVNVIVEIRFSDPMARDISAQDLHISPLFPYHISWASDGMLMLITPFESLSYEGFYMITLTDKAQAENGLHLVKDYFISFSTETTPGA